MGPAAQRFGEWASASRTFSVITDLIAVVEREVDRLCSFSCPCMHAPPPPACLLRLLLTAVTFSPSRHHTRGDGAPCRPTLRRRVGVSPGLSVSRYRHPLPPFLCDKAKTPEQYSYSGKAPVFGGQTLGTSIALGNKKPSTFFVRREDGP